MYNKKSKGWLDKDGYKVFKLKGKNIREHRYIMELHLGRPLLKTEVVHHIDHNKVNNSITNLELISSTSEHNKKHHHTAWNKGKVTINQHKCLVCGKIFETIRQPKRKYCSKTCTQKMITDKALLINKKHEGCKIKDCQRKHAANKLCKYHYYKEYYKNKPKKMGIELNITK